MRSGTVTVIILTALLLSTPVVAIVLSDEAYADEYDSQISADKELTFTGTVYFDIKPAADQLPSIVVLIADYKDDKWQYVREPCKATISDTGEFNVQSYRILHNSLSYFFLVESGYEIETVSSSFENYATVVTRDSSVVTETGGSYSYSYNAFRLIASVSSSEVTKAVTDGANAITARHATGSVTVNVTNDEYNLSNVEVRLVKKGETDPDKYTAKDYSENGRCVFNNVPTGEYDVIATLKNYEQFRSESVTVTKNGSETVSIEMILKVNNKDYWGNDLPHFLMIIGGSLGIAIVAISIVLQHFIINKKHEDWIINDVNDDEI
ncbi:MAG: carboxypeptidase-like regulatory domain-containing protein [Candidatus Methanomethylophilaceae archaeon]